MMDILINVEQTCSDLCCEVMMDMQQEALEKHPKDLPFPNGIVKENDAGDVKYTEEAQEVFYSLYKKFFNILEQAKKE